MSKRRFSNYTTLLKVPSILKGQIIQPRQRSPTAITKRAHRGVSIIEIAEVQVNSARKDTTESLALFS
jgi:hypothetical protein